MRRITLAAALLLLLSAALLTACDSGSAVRETNTAADTPTTPAARDTASEAGTEAPTEPAAEPTLMRVRVSADPGEDPFSVPPSAAPDPFITYDKDTGYYYALCTQNNYVEINRSRTVADIFIKGEKKIVYRVGKEVDNSIWAPEMYKIDGKWYIYTSAAVPSVDAYKHLFVLESKTEDPFDGFIFKSFLDNTLFAIDPTYREDTAAGKRYLCFSQVVDGLQWLGIAELENPWTFGSEPVLISDPHDYRWERMGGTPLNEGPFFISSGERVFIIYSANGCYNDNYRLGCLELTGDTVMDKASWTKSDTWLFAKTDTVFAPGHASFFHSPDGTELWIAYHCYDSRNPTQARRMRVCQVQKVGFDGTGYPVLGEPLSKDTMIPVPSGE